MQKIDIMRFSQRIGKTPVIKNLQLETIDLELKNGLWNLSKLFFLDELQRRSDYSPGNQMENFCVVLWHQHYKEAIDNIPDHDYSREQAIRARFFKYEWFEIYDFIEFLAQIEFDQVDNDDFISVVNKLLEKEFSAYRFIGNKISPISNTNEINEIESAINHSYQFTSLKVVNIHLSEALNKLSDRKTPDYRNSIKESISAVESIVKIISNNPKDSLAGALDKIKSKIKIHPALERGFKQIYGYTSDADGIRHGLMDVSDCDFEDAKFMLVSCSAFINYLIAKSAKAEITFE